MTGASSAIAMIAAMITPAVLILASASLAASALVRMARVVDRARALTSGVHDGTWEKFGATPDMLRAWLARHPRRARYAEQSIAFLYAAVVVFTATCLSIVLDRAAGESLRWLPVSLAILGALLVLAGGARMVAESRLSGEQIEEEIRHAVAKMEKKT
jgi:uncharacterized protein DUF2721